MKIRHDSWWIKWAYLLTEGWRRPEAGDVINLCPLFWRIVLITPVQCVGLLIASPLIILVVLGFYADLGIRWVWTKLLQDPTVTLATAAEDKLVSPIMDGIVAIKKRFCPRIKVE